MTTKRQTLLDLASRVEGLPANADVRPLNREVALAIGWHRYSPSEIRKSNPGWIAPEDWIGETVGKDGRRSPILDSLHGTEIWREPKNYLGSLDAAMQLVPPNHGWLGTDTHMEHWAQIVSQSNLEDGTKLNMGGPTAKAATLPLALTAAALRARAMMEPQDEN